MPFSLSEVVNDPDLAISSSCGQPLMILRSNGQFGLGGWKDQTIEISAYGVLTVASAETLQQIPEGDRVTGAMEFNCSQPLYQTSEQKPGLSDKIRWRGQLYKIIVLSPWEDFGFCQAVLVRMAGN